MDGKFLNLLQSAMLRELCRAIQKNKEDFDAANCSAESVFANIEYIYDEIPEKEFGEPTGATMKFMPKRYKEMVMRLISPECAFSYKKTESDFAVGIEAYLFLDKEDSKPVAAGTSVVSYQSFSDPSLDEFARRRMAESVAKGQAESKALQKFGIGSWFRYEFEEENPEVMLEQEKQKNSFTPTQMPMPSEIDAKPVEKPVKVETSTEIEEERKEPVPAKTTSRRSKVKSSSDEVGNDALTEARATVCTIGKANGMTLGEIEEKYPANIIWQYLQDNCEYKDTLRTIIAHNQQIMDYAKERGVVFE